MVGCLTMGRILAPFFRDSNPLDVGCLFAVLALDFCTPVKHQANLCPSPLLGGQSHPDKENRCADQVTIHLGQAVTLRMWVKFKGGLTADATFVD